MEKINNIFAIHGLSICVGIVLLAALVIYGLFNDQHIKLCEARSQAQRELLADWDIDRITQYLCKLSSGTPLTIIQEHKFAGEHGRHWSIYRNGTPYTIGVTLRGALNAIHDAQQSQQALDTSGSKTYQLRDTEDGRIEVRTPDASGGNLVLHDLDTALRALECLNDALEVRTDGHPSW